MNESDSCLRSRPIMLLAVFGGVFLGLATRSNLVSQPFVRAHFGDAFWALMIFFGLGFLFPRMSIVRVAMISGLICLTVEVSQLSNHAFLVKIRETQLGALILGRGFLPIDLIRYSGGIFGGILTEWLCCNLLQTARKAGKPGL